LLPSKIDSRYFRTFLLRRGVVFFMARRLILAPFKFNPGELSAVVSIS